MAPVLSLLIKGLSLSDAADVPMRAGVRYVDLETDRGSAGVRPRGLRTSTLHSPVHGPSAVKRAPEKS